MVALAWNHFQDRRIDQHFFSARAISTQLGALLHSSIRFANHEVVEHFFENRENFAQKVKERILLQPETRNFLRGAQLRQNAEDVDARNSKTLKR